MPYPLWNLLKAEHTRKATTEDILQGVTNDELRISFPIAHNVYAVVIRAVTKDSANVATITIARAATPDQVYASATVLGSITFTAGDSNGASRLFRLSKSSSQDFGAGEELIFRATAVSAITERFKCYALADPNIDHPSNESGGRFFITTS